jgi:hypothetical protein
MRVVTALLFALAVAGCGTEGEVGSPSASSGEGQVVTVSVTETEIDPLELEPPPIVLDGTNGRQTAVEGSYCIEYVDTSSGQGQATCSDSGPIHPKAVTAVVAGDEVTFAFPGAEIVSGSGCYSDDPQGCIGEVIVRPLGCDDRTIETVALAPGPQTRWTVDLEPGAYELDVFGYFESDAGATGDVSGTLGLTVAGGKKWDALGVGAVKPSMEVCALD